MNSSAEYEPSDPKLMFVLDRVWTWEQASNAMKRAGLVVNANDILNLAEFLTGENGDGDDRNSPFVSMFSGDDDDEDDESDDDSSQ